MQNFTKTQFKYFFRLLILCTSELTKNLHFNFYITININRWAGRSLLMFHSSPQLWCLRNSNTSKPAAPVSAGNWFSDQSYHIVAFQASFASLLHFEGWSTATHIEYSLWFLRYLLYVLPSIVSLFFRKTENFEFDAVYMLVITVVIHSPVLRLILELDPQEHVQLCTLLLV